MARTDRLRGALSKWKRRGSAEALVPRRGGDDEDESIKPARPSLDVRAYEKKPK